MTLPRTAAVYQHLPSSSNELTSTRKFTPLPGEVRGYELLPSLISDRHPELRNVVIANACSGHGFKVAPALGEILADLAQEEQPEFDISMFSLNRFLLNGT